MSCTTGSPCCPHHLRSDSHSSPDEFQTPLTSYPTLSHELGVLDQDRSITGDRLIQLRTVLEESQCHLLRKDDHFEIIIDSGCSKVVSPEPADFIPGSLVDLPIPLSMDGIAGSLVARQKGMVRYEVLNDKGDVSIITCEGYYLPSLRVRLLSSSMDAPPSRG